MFNKKYCACGLCLCRMARKEAPAACKAAPAVLPLAFFCFILFHSFCANRCFATRRLRRASITNAMVVPTLFYIFLAHMVLTVALQRSACGAQASLTLDAMSVRHTKLHPRLTKPCLLQRTKPRLSLTQWLSGRRLNIHIDRQIARISIHSLDLQTCFIFVFINLEGTLKTVRL